MSNSKSVGIFGKIKGVFVEETPDETAAAPVAPAVAVPVPVRAAFIPGSPDPTIVTKLEAKLAAAIPPVYAAFIEQYEGLKDFIPDESTRFKAALKASKASVEQLATALDTLVETMSTAKAEFDTTFEANKAKANAASQKAIGDLASDIFTREGQIKALEAELQTMVNSRQEATVRVATEERRLDGLRGGFDAAHAMILGRLNDQKTRVASQRG